MPTVVALAGGSVPKEIAGVPEGTYAGCGIKLKSHMTFELESGATLQGLAEDGDDA